MTKTFKVVVITGENTYTFSQENKYGYKAARQCARHVMAKYNEKVVEVIIKYDHGR